MSSRVFGTGETTLNGVSNGDGHHMGLEREDKARADVISSPRCSARTPSSRSSGFTLAKMSREKRARRVRFYRNGDRFFKGMVYAVSSERFRNFENLLSSLTSSSVCDTRIMAHGIRHIFSMDGARRINDLDELVDGESYVCASSDVFCTLDYSKNEDHDWTPFASTRNASGERPSSTTPKRVERWASNHSDQQHRSLSSQSQPEGMLERPASTTAQLSQSMLSSSKEYQKYQQSFVAPRLITVLKQGKRPRRAVRLLLNKKTAQNFEQVMSDITDAVKLDSGCVQRLYGLSGRRVTSLADLFLEDTIFIASGKERLTHEDLIMDPREVRQVNAYRPFVTKGRERVTLRRARTRDRGSEKTSSRASSCTRNSPASGPDLGCKRDSGVSGRDLGRKRDSAVSDDSGITSGKSILDNFEQLLGKEAERDSCPDELKPEETDEEKTTDINDIPKPVTLTNKYMIGPMIGTGNFAVVYECKEKKTKRKFALKIIDKESCKGKEKMIDNEVRILRCVKHPNIIRLIEDFSNQHRLFYIMELVRGGDLFDAIATSTKYTEHDAGGMLSNLANALEYLHNMHIVHRDVKPENLLIRQHEDGSKSLKLGDFGLATEVKGSLHTVCGTPTYVAPEVIAETGYGVKIDVWSAGVIAYILLCGFPPFSSPSDNQDELFDLILTASYDFPNPYWEDVSASAKNLIKRMLDIDPDRRLSATQVLNHRWISCDTAYAADLQKTVTSELSTFLSSSPTRSAPRNPGIQIIADRPVDCPEASSVVRGQDSVMRSQDSLVRGQGSLVRGQDSALRGQESSVVWGQESSQIQYDCRAKAGAEE